MLIVPNLMNVPLSQRKMISQSVLNIIRDVFLTVRIVFTKLNVQNI